MIVIVRKMLSYFSILTPLLPQRLLNQIISSKTQDVQTRRIRNLKLCNIYSWPKF